MSLESGQTIESLLETGNAVASLDDTTRHNSSMYTAPQGLTIINMDPLRYLFNSPFLFTGLTNTLRFIRKEMTGSILRREYSSTGKC